VQALPARRIAVTRLFRIFTIRDGDGASRDDSRDRDASPDRARGREQLYNRLAC